MNKGGGKDLKLQDKQNLGKGFTFSENLENPIV